MTDYSELFSEQGPFAGTIDGYAPRAGQTRMAEAVGRALADLDSLIVEAGTGTGKTLAYLVPALLSGRRVVISTGTKTLQDQLFGKDIPAVARALGMPVKIALLKGRANYLCLQRLAVNGSEPGSGTRSNEFAVISAWARATADGDIADVSDLPEDASIWPQVTSTAENCLGQKCPEYERCFVVKARRRAQQADVVVVNHHLLMADFALKEEGFGELLPDADAFIIDEAHQLPEIAQRFFGRSLSTRQIKNLARDAIAAGLAAGVHRQIESATDALGRRADDLRLTLRVRSGRFAWEQLPDALPLKLDDVAESIGHLSDILGTVAEHDATLGHCRQRAEETLATLRAIRSDEDANDIRWVDVAARSLTLHRSPLDVAPQMSEVLAVHDAAWIFTSATLAVGDDFSHFESRVGTTDARSLKLESPFDFKHNSLLYLPESLPDPQDPGHTEAVVETAMRVVDAAGGGAFMLFTSHRALREAAGILEDTGYPLLVQGDAPRDDLLERFRRHGNALLLGTASFWEGVDVRGEALRVVVIDKLPFAAPSDPVLSARLKAISEAGGNAFASVQLPQAVIALKQGVGRLIRDPADFGVVVLCDPRLMRRSYGRVFLNSLPPMPVTHALDDVSSFLHKQITPAMSGVVS